MHSPVTPIGVWLLSSLAACGQHEPAVLTQDASARSADVKHVPLSAPALSAPTQSHTGGVPPYSESAALERSLKSRDSWDQVMRDQLADQRTQLKAAAKRHTVDASGASRIDTYELKDGRIIMCRTKVLASAPAVMTCDGQL
jgi:hypothetical protein